MYRTVSPRGSFRRLNTWRHIFVQLRCATTGAVTPCTIPGRAVHFVLVTLHPAHDDLSVLHFTVVPIGPSFCKCPGNRDGKKYKKNVL